MYPDKKPFNFRVVYKQSRECWKVTCDGNHRNMPTLLVMEAIDHILSIHGNQEAIEFGPFLIRGVDATQLARMQDYLSMVKESWESN